MLGIDGARIHQRFLEIAYVEGDPAATAREIQWFAGKPEEYLSLGLQAADRNVHGRRGESHKLYQRAAETALRRGLRSAAWAVPPWRSRCAAMRPRRKSSLRGLRSFFQTERSGMPCSYPGFARRS